MQSLVLLSALYRSQPLATWLLGKISTTAVLDKVENLLWSWLQLWHRNCYSNKMMPLSVLPKSFAIALSSNSRLNVYEAIRTLSRSTFWGEVFMVKYMVKTGQCDFRPLSVENEALLKCNFTSWEVLIFLKTRAKGHGDSSSRLLERRIWSVFNYINYGLAFLIL